jgi:hypothetical protein
MAIIFDFKPADPPARDAQPRSASTSCEVILFPGVRYERWDVTPPPAPIADPSGGQSRKRRTKKRISEMAD